jgi:homoserine dehydrogenase
MQYLVVDQLTSAEHHTTRHQIQNPQHGKETRHRHHGCVAKTKTARKLTTPGFGGVGRSFVKQLEALKDRLAGRPDPIELRWIAAANSKHALHTLSPGIDFRADWLAELNKSATAPSQDALLAFLATSPAPVVLVDCSASPAVAAGYPALLARGVSVVTPNKLAFSGGLAEWDALWGAARNGAGGGRGRGYLFHESTVGAGLPVLSTLRELVGTGDEVRRIEGVVSGTLSFLFNEWDPATTTTAAGEGGGAKFSAVVRRARDLGFTEPDPRADLGGLDVARKLAILARVAGLRVEGFASFPIESLVPAQLAAVDGADAFLDGLAAFDGEMEAVRAEANAAGKVVRYVGSVDVVGGEVKVGLERFDRSHPIAGLKGSDNIISIYTKRYGANPLIIQGAG